jgi:hypothetical protein
MPCRPDVRYGHPCPPLTACGPRFAILASLGLQRRLLGTGSPLADAAPYVVRFCSPVPPEPDCLPSFDSPSRIMTKHSQYRLLIVPPSLRGCHPCRSFGALPMPCRPDVRYGHPCPPLTACGPRFAILASLAREPGFHGTGYPLAGCVTGRESRRDIPWSRIVQRGCLTVGGRGNL